MTSNAARKREIREYAATHGLSYTAAMRQLEAAAPANCCGHSEITRGCECTAAECRCEIGRRDLDQQRRTVAVVDLLDRSHRAYAAGDAAQADELGNEAARVDINAIMVISGGITIGEIPNPETHPKQWHDFVLANHDGLAHAEAEWAADAQP